MGAPTGLELRPEAVGPWLALLHRLNELAEEGRSTPCLVDPAPFTSDDPDDRAEAAESCAWCAAKRPCGVYATANRERWHVWAGEDRTPAARRRAAA